MPKKPKKPKPREDYQQIARRVLDSIAPDAEPKKSERRPVKRRRIRKHAR
jgi:hypothetical protein